MKGQGHPVGTLILKPRVLDGMAEDMDRGCRLTSEELASQIKLSIERETEPSSIYLTVKELALHQFLKCSFNYLVFISHFSSASQNVI